MTAPPAPSSTFEGFDEDTPSTGRGWAALGTAGRVVGHIFIHNGDNSGFVAEPDWLLQQPANGWPARASVEMDRSTDAKYG